MRVSAEFASYIEQVKELNEVLIELWAEMNEKITELWAEKILGGAVKILGAIEDIEKERSIRATWIVCRDDRRPHLVLDRRPMHRPQKIL